MDTYSSETGNSSTLNRPPVLLAASSSAAMMRAERPDSQFFTVPTVYRISVTLSTTIFPTWFLFAAAMRRLHATFRRTHERKCGNVTQVVAHCGSMGAELMGTDSCH